jgi:hypothetical protein
MKVRIGCHTFRATGITAYLEAGGTLENAQAMAAHESPRYADLGPSRRVESREGALALERPLLALWFPRPSGRWGCYGTARSL